LTLKGERSHTTRSKMAQESILEKALTEYGQARGVYVRKFTSHHTKVPDRIFTKELTLFLEIKAAGKFPDPGQRNEIGTICSVGGYASWTSSEEVGKKLIDLVADNLPKSLRIACDERNYWSL
jgi:hypothetical protein